FTSFYYCFILTPHRFYLYTLSLHDALPISSDIMDEAAALTPSFAGVSYNRLEGYDSLQWPVDKDGTDSPLLYVDGFPFPDGKARLYPLEFEFDYDTSDKYDLHVNNGRVLEYFHEGNMTYKSPGLKDKLPTTFLEVA